MNCTFFGHKDVPDTIKAKIKNEINKLLEQKSVSCFYVGNNGNFDSTVQSVLEELSRERKDITYYIVLSYINELALNGKQEKTIYPEGLENTPLRFAIAKRNDWMINNSSMIIAYQKYKGTNSFKLIEKARKKSKVIVNLADQENSVFLLFFTILLTINH